MSKVYFVSVKNGEGAASLSDKTIALLQKLSVVGTIKENDLVAIKVHFGDKDNRGHVNARIAKQVAEFLKKKSDRVFITDTNTLYRGLRSNSVDHLRLASEHGFDLATLGVPVIIGDGLTGRNFSSIEIPGKHMRSAKVASDIVNTDFLVCLSHMTGHMQTGFGSTIKNLGMGCASRAGKLEQHSNVLPAVTAEKCVGCGECITWCPSDAIEIEDEKAIIAQGRCIGCGECIVVCKAGAIAIKWSESIPVLQEKMAEYACAAARAVGPGRQAYINYLIHITKDCDCMAKDEAPICDDIGIMASVDPVALDRASVDILIKANKKDIFKIGYPDIDWSTQLGHAQAMGLGTTSYELEELPQ